MNETGVSEGQVLGRYELLLRVAQGGMARVWAARLHGTRGFRKLVAVKTILPGVMDGERLEQMFLEEATLASGIHHPNVVDTLELGEHEGILFMALEWVDGEPLSLLMHEARKLGGIPLPIGVNLIAQVCKGLHAAHELTDDAGAPLGVVHRDVSPHNILVTFSGIAKVVDFGIAKATQRSSELTEAGEVKGKLAFMAPEQIRGRPVDRRTDVFALGTLLYTITTGEHPWKGDHPGETTQRLVSDRPAKPPSELKDDYPPALEAVVLTALEKDPDKRFPTAAAMLAALEEAVPSSLEGSAESRIAGFMKGLVGPRGIERRKQIRLAGELLDQRRALTGVTTITGTSGSTRAVVADAGISVGSLSQVNLIESSQVTPSLITVRRRFDKFIWIGVAAVFAGCLGFAARRGLSDNAAERPRSAATSVDSGAARSVVATPAAEPRREKTAAEGLRAGLDTPLSADSERDAASERDVESERDGMPREKTRRERSGARTRVARPVADPALAAPRPPASATSETAKPPSSASSTTAAPKGSANAWNPQTFGNRY